MSTTPPPDEAEGPAQKVSISMPAGRVAAVKARVGARGFSAYVSAAVERQIQRDLLEEALQDIESRIGPPSPELQQWADDIFRDAEAMAARERQASADEGDDAWHDRKAG